MRAQVEEVLNQVRPALQADGGDVELVSVENGIVKVRLQGACAGCPMSQMTLRNSVAGRIGSFLEPVSQWAGFDWRTNIALVGGFAAKEVIVSTFGTAYSLGEVDPEETESLSRRLAADPAWNPVTAVALIVFVLLYAPCFVTVVTMARESSWRWAFFSTVFNTALGFVLAVVAYQLGSLLLV